MNNQICGAVHPRDSHLICGHLPHEDGYHGVYAASGSWVGWSDEDAAMDGDAIVEARRGVYGDPTETYVRVAAIMSAILDHEVQPWQAPLLMVAVKLVRTAETPDYSDNSDDIDGYMKMFREIMGSDMVQAKSVAEYLEQKAARS